MKITVQIDGVKRSATRQADHVIVAGACPHCAVKPFKVKGGGITTNDHDSYYAEGGCVACGKHVGTIRATVDTIFGIEEDERVLNGRFRVY